MADNDNDDLRQRMEAQEQTSKAQQEVLDSIQQMLTQLLTNQNNDVRSNHNEEEHNDDEQPKTEKSKESSSIDAKVLKGIQAQDCILSSEGWVEEDRHDSSLSTWMGLSAISYKI